MREFDLEKDGRAWPKAGLWGSSRRAAFGSTRDLETHLHIGERDIALLIQWSLDLIGVRLLLNVQRLLHG